LDQELGNFGGWFEILGNYGWVGIVDMQYLQTLVISQSVEDSGDGLGPWDWVFQFLHAFCEIGENVGGTPNPDIAYPRVQCYTYFSDHIFFRSPKWDAFLGLDTEFATSLETYTTLIQLDFVG
tara:strand:- start:115 stop:483 length:369 start_codon:yes stop_codon:yes gene_type:complete